MKEKQKRGLALKVILGAIFVILLLVIVSLSNRLAELEKQLREAISAIEQKQDVIDELTYDLSLSKEEYIEKYAREYLNYHQKGEIIFENGEK